MVRQRHIFEPGRVDILRDGDKPQADRTPGALIVAAFEQGVKIKGVCKSARRGYSDLPLFKGPDTQQNLFV